MTQITYSTTLVVITCGDCGIPFGLPQNHLNRLKRDGSLFYCPNGDRICYSENENTRLKAELDQVSADRAAWREEARLRRAQLEGEKRHHAATKGQLTKTKKRVQNGVCPCCRRSFPELQHHMETEHPDYMEGK